MEVITYGGGEFIRDMFNAVAALVGLGSFASALRLSLLLGLLFVLFHAAFSMNLWTTVRWFTASLIIYLCLLVPKTTVQVVDRFDPGLPGATVANVPLGLALVASLTTTVGDEFTEQTEVAFALPGDLQCQENGFIYGSKVFKDAMSFQVTDAVFGENLSGFIRTCVFYDLLEHRYSVTDLRETNDLWAFLTVTHPPNPARFYEWVNSGGATVVKSCDQAAIDLDGQWAAETNRIARIYGKQIAPRLSEAAAEALVLNTLTRAHDFFLGSARAASDQIRQATLGNLIDKSVRDQGAELGADALLDAYSQARTEAEQGRAIREGARLAERWVPLFRTVAETLFYGLFPILFPLFLLPESGFRLLRGYVSGFVVLMAWGPLYVILHRIMMGTAGSRSLGAAYTPTSGEEITLVTQAGIEAVHADIAMIAGYMTLMIPFVAGAIGKGAGTAFSGLSQTLLHPAQTAAQGAAREASTGNISLGSTSFDTHRFSSIDGNRMATSAFVDTGEATWNTPEGGRMRRSASGASIYDGRSAISSGGTHVDYQGGLATALQSEASWSLEQRDSAAQRSSKAVSALAHQIGDVGWHVSNGRSFEEATGFSLDTRQAKTFNELVSNASRFAERFTEGKESEFAFQAYMQASASKNFEVPLLPKFRAQAGVRGSAGWAAKRAEIYEAALDASRTNTSSRAFDDVVSTFDRDSATASQSQSSSWRDAFAANLQEMDSASQDQERYTARSNSAREMASHVEREGAGFTANWDNAFLSHMAGQDRGDGHAVGMNEATRRWTSGDLADRLWVERQAREFIDTQADELLDRPDLGGFVMPQREGIDGPASFTEIEEQGAENHQRAQDYRAAPPIEGFEAAEFDDRHADGVRRQSEAVADFAQTMVERSSQDQSRAGQLRKFTVQSRVQDSRDGEWDEFARGEPDEMPDDYANVWRKSKPLPGIGSAPVDGSLQRQAEERMPSDQLLSPTREHYETGAERLDQD
ncbi:MAG: conjugal transfer protein TraG N-terminal domain-containing protein [Pseudomonadota bacterium]